ncbi:sialidase family protein [Coraliomargarita sp. W4R53]
MKTEIIALLATSLLTSVSVADVIYRQTFDSPSGINVSLSEVGWNVNVADGASLEGTSFQPKGPLLSGGSFLYAYNQGENSLVWTGDASFGPISSITSISMSLFNELAEGEDLQFVLQVDGNWYVSQGVFNGSGFAIRDLDVKNASWNHLEFIAEESLAVGALANLPESGTLQAVGVYNNKLSGKVRIDDFTVHGNASLPSNGAPSASANQASSDIPVPSEKALLRGYVMPLPIFNPGVEYGTNARNYQGVASMERAPGGRLWATWYAGPVWEDRFNYMLVATSGDDGETWTDVSFVIDPDGAGPKRVADPVLWLDPDGKLWLFFWLNGDGLSVTMAITTDNPDAASPVWSEPFPLFPDVMMNKPIVTSKGEWLMPTSKRGHGDDSSQVIASTDKGKTWALRGAANVPVERRNFDEAMIVERKDGSLWMLVRTADYGIGESVSTDDGKTWTEVEDYQVHATTRFTLLKLKSGNLLLLRQGALEERNLRTHLSAYLSDDDGMTWKGGLLLDERPSSYPDATQAPDGTIYAIYDQNRGGNKGIVMSVFTEADILAGQFSSPQARSKVLINQAMGDNPTVGRTGAGPAPRADNTAATLITGKPRAGLKPLTGEVLRAPGAANYAFTDQDYLTRIMIDLRPILPSAKEFVFSPMEETEVVCASPGMVYVLTPAPDRNSDSVEAELLAQGFEKTSVKELDVLIKTDEKARYENLCSLYQKELKTGDRVKFGKWGIMIF